MKDTNKVRYTMNLNQHTKMGNNVQGGIKKFEVKWHD